MNRHQLLSVGINNCSYDTFLETTLALPDAKESSYVCFANVHMLVECNCDHQYRDMINCADLVAPDGKPVAVLVTLSARKRQEKISGPDFFNDLLAACCEKGKSVFFYGSTPSLLEKLIQRVKSRFPQLEIRGCYSPPFRALTPEENEATANLINAAGPDFLFVALGCPKQERWMAENSGKIRACMLGFGQAFQIFAGELKRAPGWMQNAGLEWAFRLFSEPGRLWRRYVYTNTYFFYLLLRYAITRSRYTDRQRERQLAETTTTS